MTEQMKKEPAQKAYTREDVKAFLDEIASHVADGSVPTFHTMLALNSMLRLDNARELFDQELIKQAKDLWLNIKANGVHLVDPPLLFGETPEVNILLHLEDYAQDSDEDSSGATQSAQIPA